MGTTVGPDARVPDRVDAILDHGRMASDGVRAATIWAASSVKGATALAAIHCYSRSNPVPHLAIRVYQVQLVPFRMAPVAPIDELRDRMLTGAPVQRLIEEYWKPTGVWHVREVLAPSLTVIEEVAPAPEGDIYIQRWVRYNEDRDRARLL